MNDQHSVVGGIVVSGSVAGGSVAGGSMASGSVAKATGRRRRPPPQAAADRRICESYVKWGHPSSLVVLHKPMLCILILMVLNFGTPEIWKGNR